MTEEQIIQVIKEGPITITLTEADVQEALLEICEYEHASCNACCPVFEIDNRLPDNNGENCHCFKSGKTMFNFLKNRLS